MKKLLLISFLLINVIRSEGQAWIYHPFPSSDALWRENSGEYTCNCCRDYQYTINGDTTIGSNTYHRLKWTGIIKSDPNVPLVGGSYWGCPGTFMAYLSSSTGSYYAGAFRDDIANKKVYFMEPGNITDTLLYDFNLSAGDTLPNSYVNQHDGGYPGNFVSSVDSVLVGSSYHKRFNINSGLSGSSTPYVSIIEGVGSTFGLLGYLLPPFEIQNVLDCFKLADTSAYQPPGGFGCADVATLVKELNSFDRNIYIYPNPGNGNYHLDMNFLNDVIIEVKEVLGNTVMNMKLKSPSTEIDLTSEPIGIYFLRISDSKGNSVTKKVVKQ